MSKFALYDRSSMSALRSKIKEYFYRKSEVYNKTEIDSMLSLGLKIRIVQTLPQIGESGYIYLVPKDVPEGVGAERNVYDEYIWIEIQGQPAYFEYIGTTETQVDLSNYYTKSETDGLLNVKQASITITPNANTPTDNDTIVMQDSGNTSTTSFIRRTLSKLWDYIKGKDGYPEARLAFGGKNLTNATSPVDAAFIPDLSANRAAFINPDCVDVLYSEDGGVTWQNYGLTDWEKQRLLCDERSVIVGKRSSSQHADAQCLLRVFIHDTTSYFYAKIQKIAIYCATNGSEGCYCNVTGRKQVDINNNVDSWDTLADHVSISGWSGWNIIQTSFITYGGNATSYHINNYYGQIRLDFGISGPTAADNGAGLSISRIRMYGTECWGGSMSYLAKYGNPFVLREGKKCVFEGPIAVKDGTASQVLLANGDVMSLPVPINKGGTGSTTAIGAEYNILNQVADSTAQLADLNDNRKIALCNLTKSSTNGVFRWMTLGLLWNYMKNKISSVLGIDENSLNSKVNLQADYTINTIAYASVNVNKYQKLLRFPQHVRVIMNVNETHTMYGRTDSFTNMIIIDGYSSSISNVTTLVNSELRVVRDSGYNFLVCPCPSYYGSPTKTYRIQILFSNIDRSDISVVDSSVVIDANPKDNFVIYNKPLTLGSYTFSMYGSSVNLYMTQGVDKFYSFIGNVNGTIGENYTIYLNDVEIGQVYQFVFTENIPSGLTFYDSDSYYQACKINQEIGAGDTITLTAVEAVENGWLYSIQKFEIESPDESIDIKYSNGITKLEVSERFVRNVAEANYENDEQIAIGSYSRTLKLTGDNSARYAYTKVFSLQSFKVDGGSDEFYHVVTQGTTYTISVGSYSTQFTAARSGCVVLVSSSNNELFNYNIGFYTSDGYYNEFYTNDIQAFRNYSICLLDETSSSVFALLDSSTIVKVWGKTYISAICTALGDSSEASGMYATAFGYFARAYNEHSIAIGYASLVLGASSIVMGGSAKALKNYSVAIGVNSRVFGSSVGIGYNARCADSGVSIGANSSSENSGVAVGNYASSSGNDAVAIGNSSHANNVRAVAIGYANASGSGAVAIGYNGRGFGYTSIAILGSAGGTNAIAIGFLANVADNKNDSVAIGYLAKCSDDDSVALGSNTESVGRNSVSIGTSTKCNTNYSIAIGNYCNSVGTDCIAIGDNVQSGNVSNDNNRQYLTTIKMTCVPYECDSQTIYNKRSDVDLYVTIDNHQYTLTPPSTNRQLVIVNNSNAQYLKYGSANGYEYVLVDGIWRNVNYVSGTLSGCVTHLHDNYYAVWLYCADASYHQATESFVFYPLMTTATTPQKSYCVGGDINSYHRNSHAIGYKCVTSAENQFIIGNYNTLNDNARFIVGGGDSMSRKNILEIDSDDRLKINASLIGGTQTINMTQQTGSLSNITKSIYKIKWSGTGTIRLTLGTNGCVEGQRVSIAAVTNDVVIGTSILIPSGTFGDLLFLDGSWVPSSGIWHV